MVSYPGLLLHENIRCPSISGKDVPRFLLDRRSLQVLCSDFPPKKRAPHTIVWRAKLTRYHLHYVQNAKYCFPEFIYSLRSVVHISLSCNAGIAWKLTADITACSVSRLRSYLQWMRISKCLPPQLSLDISLWEGIYLLLFFNAFRCSGLISL